ncbi:MAG: glycosyltransferase [Clostridiales bacterium]|jgi:radical SAM protein with 4Fe4S-binding SPASM domain|nr:glycosyltransferase [Clostridiales bacterium]
MKIVVCGTRGFPNIQGGIETHCEELYPRIAAAGEDVTVVRRRGYVTDKSSLTYKGVKFKDIHVPKINGVESAIHTLLSVFYAKKAHAEVLHIHGVGPSIVVPIAKLLGLKVVVTHHGPDYERKKWGPFARFVLRTGEFLAARMADEIIAISPVICGILKNRYKRTKHVRLIYNGVNLPVQAATAATYPESLGLERGKYVLAVGRFVKEKNFDRLIDAFLSSEEAASMRLAIAGDSDIETSYSRDLKAKAKAKGVVLTGMIKGRDLAELYANAALFVLPSSHEGLPITLLEAMSYKRKVLVSNIPANLAVGLEADSYFKSDDWEELSRKMSAQLKKENREQTYDLSVYDWSRISTDTLEVYRRVLHPAAPPTDMCIILTYRCPMRCKMCNIWENPTEKEREITPEEIKRLPKVKFINITGGEPFVREDLEQIIEICFTKSPRVVISTSGWYEDRLLALAKKFPRIGIRISIEGLAQKNDELRGRQGGFEKGLRLLEKLRAMGVKDIGFGCTVSNNNSADMLELYKLARSMKIEFATAAFHNSYYFHKYDNVITNTEEVCRNFEKLVNLQLREPHPKSWFRAFFNMGLINYIEGNKRLLPCEAGLVNFFVEPYGDVYPCNGLEEKYWKETMGNIRETPDFQEIWEGGQAEKVRNKVRCCPKNCWMVGTVSPVMKKYLRTPLRWSVGNKIRSLAGKPAKLNKTI